MGHGYTYMNETKSPDDRRAQRVALAGFAIQLAGLGLLIGLARWSESSMLSALSRFMLLGVPVWLVLYLVLNQVRRVGIESLETEELRRAREAGTDVALFEVDDEGLLVEQNRLRWFLHWLLGACTVLLALVLIGGHFVYWGWSMDEAFSGEVLSPTAEPTMMMWFVVGLGFFCFLFARYVMALARLPQWGLLRAGATCLSGGALACVLAAIALMASNTLTWVEPVVCYIFRLALLVLGIEFSINFVLDLYRPRVPGEVPRPSFDSRLLGMLADPGGIAKSIADAVNYQFGFQVSSTWFYQLLQRWLFPLMVMACLGVVLLSSVVIVDADEEALIERWGSPASEQQTISSGIWFKWPFPKDVVYRAPVHRISQMVIGESEDEEHDHQGAILWTEAHEYIPELMLLVATPKRSGTLVAQGTADAKRSDVSESVAVSLLMVSVPIEYRIKNLKHFLYNYDDPKKVLEAVANQYLTDLAASVDVDELMGPKRTEFNSELATSIQSRLDELETGIEIVFAGVRDAHPTAQKKVAAAFESVVAAQTQMGAMVHASRGEANSLLTRTVGSVSRAVALDNAIQARDRHGIGTPEHAKAEEAVQALFAGDPQRGLSPVSGRAAKIVADARADASRKVGEASAKVREFGAQLAAYRAAPELFKHRQYLKVYEGIETTRKYVLIGDRSNVIIEYETSKEAGLDQVLSTGTGSGGQ